MCVRACVCVCVYVCVCASVYACMRGWRVLGDVLRECVRVLVYGGGCFYVTVNEEMFVF